MSETPARSRWCTSTASPRRNSGAGATRAGGAGESLANSAFSASHGSGSLYCARNALRCSGIVENMAKPVPPTAAQRAGIGGPRVPRSRLHRQGGRPGKRHGYASVAMAPGRDVASRQTQTPGALLTLAQMGGRPKKDVAAPAYRGTQRVILSREVTLVVT
jgi:hypothetical protein